MRRLPRLQGFVAAGLLVSMVHCSPTQAVPRWMKRVAHPLQKLGSDLQHASFIRRNRPKTGRGNAKTPRLLPGVLESIGGGILMSGGVSTALQGFSDPVEGTVGLVATIIGSLVMIHGFQQVTPMQADPNED